MSIQTKGCFNYTIWTGGEFRRKVNTEDFSLETKVCTQLQLYLWIICLKVIIQNVEGLQMMFGFQDSWQKLISLSEGLYLPYLDLTFHNLVPSCLHLN